MANVMTGKLRFVMVPDRIKDAVPEGYREKGHAKYPDASLHG